MKQTLREYLNSIDPDSRIAIGTLNGCGYIFFGTAGQTEQITKDFYRRHQRLSQTAWANYMMEYIDPLDRIVEKRYKKFVDDCEGIVISGDEAGRYWLESEYKKAHKIA